MSGAQAILILIDNTETTLNGDFYPNRLDAEKIAAERLFQYYVRKSAKTQVAIGTFGTKYFGIQASLTTRHAKISKTIAEINRGGENDFEHAIRCGFLALRHRDAQITIKRIVLFICSINTFTDEKAALLAADANREGVAIDIIAFGNDVNNTDILEEFTQKIHSPSVYVRAHPGRLILSDIVLSSPIGPGHDSTHTFLDPNLEDDPDVALAIRQSLEQTENNDDELQAAIKASLAEAQSKGYGLGDDEDELLEAIKLSLMDKDDDFSQFAHEEEVKEPDTDDTDEFEQINDQFPQFFHQPRENRPIIEDLLDIGDDAMRNDLFESMQFDNKNRRKSNSAILQDLNEKDNSFEKGEEEEDDPLMSALLETIKENEENKKRK